MFSIKTLTKKTLLFLCIFAFLFLSFSSIFNPHVYAAKSSISACTTPDELKEFWDAHKNDSGYLGVHNTAMNMALEVYGNGMFDAIKGVLTFDINTTYDDKYVTGATASNPVAEGVWALMEKVYKQIIPAGYALVILFFLIDLLEKTTQDNFNIEHFFRCLIKLILGVIVVNSGLEILATLIAFSNSIFGLITDPGSVSDSNMTLLREYATKIYEADTYLKILDPVGVIIELIIPYIIMFGCGIYANVIAFSRLIEIGIMGMFAPLGMADIMSEGTRGNGFRYFKKFLALLLQGALIIGCLALYSSINAQVAATSNGLSSLATMLVSALALVTMISKSQTVALAITGG